MITSKRFKISYIEVGTTEVKTVTMEITADQLTQTVRRRMNTLLPNVRITDITEPSENELALEPAKKTTR